MRPERLDWWFFGGIFGVLVLALALAHAWSKRGDGTRTKARKAVTLIRLFTVLWVFVIFAAVLLTGMDDLD